MNAYRARPNFIPWPPLLLVGVTLTAILLHMISPLALEFTGARPAGIALIGLALSVDLWAMSTLHEGHTTILPNRRSSHLVTQGPFRFSRNPIYVANLLLIIGMGCVSMNGWFALLAPVDALLTHFLAVRREENHLLANFGFQYETYCSKVRRWV